MKLVLMKYLNSRGLPCYSRITEDEAPGSDEARLDMMELEAEEMLFSGEMKEKLWIKCLDKEQYKQLMDEEARARQETLDKIIRTWEES
ncbi:MAG: hypothetical protein Q4F56_02560 [Candidatus Saccharibacteria bacterium]|nr:hypothetical protein [Candidatus Saccharibacteria bacterium]